MTDDVLEEIAAYVEKGPTSPDFDTARLCLLDAIGCALLSLKTPACTKLLGPIIEGTTVPKGSRVIGTPYILDPIRAAFTRLLGVAT